MKSKHIDYDNNPINFEEISKFKVSEQPIGPSNNVFSIHICLDHDLFLTAQILGAVTIFSLSTCQTLGLVNQGHVTLPMQLRLLQEYTADPASKKDSGQQPSKKLSMTTSLLSHQIKEFKKRNTKPAAWSQRLQHSRQNNSHKFKSHILDSMQEMQHRKNASTTVAPGFNQRFSRINPSAVLASLENPLDDENRPQLIGNELANKDYQTIQNDGSSHGLNFYNPDQESLQNMMQSVDLVESKEALSMLAGA